MVEYVDKLSLTACRNDVQTLVLSPNEDMLGVGPYHVMIKSNRNFAVS